MNLFKLALYVIYALVALNAVVKIGLDRKPITPADAVWTLIGVAGIVALVHFA